MSRPSTSEFAAALPVPLGTPADEAAARLGDGVRVHAHEGRTTGLEDRARGLWLAVEDGVVASVSFLTGTADEGGARYDGALPGGLTAADRPEDVLERWGAPDRIQEIPLARPAKAKMILSFWDLDPATTLLVAVRSERPARLDRIVLGRRGGA